MTTIIEILLMGVLFAIGYISGDIYITNRKIDKIESILIEMNDRQKSVVVTQHKAIEDKIAEMCGR